MEMRKLFSLFTVVAMLLSALSVVVFASETQEYTTREDIVGYSAALVERKSLSKVENIQKYWDDETGDIKEYKITNATDLVFFADLVKQKQEFYGMTVYLANDIDLSSVEVFEPIGGWSPGGTWATPCFRGTFDGQGYAIKKMNMTMPTEENASKKPVDANNAYLGLFRCLGFGTTVKNLILDDTCVVSGGENKDASVVGAITGCIDGNQGASTAAEHTVVFSNIYSAAKVTHGGVAGGLVGVAKSIYLTVDHCTVAGDIKLVEGATGPSFNGRGVGGLIGMMGETKSYPISVLITNSRNAGNVESFNGPVGGIVGQFPTPAASENVKKLEIDNCINTGNVSVIDTGKPPVAAAGIIGYYGVTTSGGSLTVKNCANYGTATAPEGVATNQIVNQIADAANVTLESNLEKQGETDATLAEALWQNLVPIAAPVDPDDGDDKGSDDKGSDDKGSDDKGSDDKKEEVTSGKTETKAPEIDEETKTPTGERGGQTTEEKNKEAVSGCGSSVLAVLPMSLIVIASVAMIRRKKED